MDSVIRFRREPSKEAKVGVFVFTSYTLHLTFRYLHTLTATSSTLILLVIALISTFFLFVEPIPQPQSYHNFADKRRFLCSCHATTEGFFLPPDTKRRTGFVIPNFGDVVSNIVILAGGVFGLALLHFDENADAVAEQPRKWQLQVCLPIFFSSTIAISAGSTYYHWSPNDNSLVWDRLPMTLAFVSIFCFMLEEYMPAIGIGQSLMTPLLILGIFSVLYWRWIGDLRLYALVQFLPLLVMGGLVIGCQQPRHGGAIQQTVALVCYAVAKVCEERDYEIFHWTNKRISGHSLKHVIAALASFSIASMMMINQEN